MIIHDCIQGSAEWHSIKLGIPSGAGAKKLVHGNGYLASESTLNGLADELAAEIYIGERLDSWEGNKYTKRGLEVEPLARRWYAYEYGYDVTEVGFCTDPLERYGASPDGIVVDISGNNIGGVEFKCLPTGHLKALLYYDKHGKVQPDYIPQVQMNLLVTGLPWWDLVYYHQKLPALCVRIEPDPDFIDALKKQITACLMRRNKTLETLKKMGAV